MQEMTARHGSAYTATKRIRYKFFRKTSVHYQKKLDVGTSLVLSRELYGCGSWPVLSTAESARLHANVGGHFRGVLGEGHCDTDTPTMTDAQLYTVYELRTPLTYVRFSRLRLSIRIVRQATDELLALLYASRTDSRSWLRALLADLEWIACVNYDFKFSPAEWFDFCRSDAKAARSLVRKACDSDGARALCISQFRPSSFTASYFSCPCGKICKTRAGYATHQYRMHGIRAPAVWYTSPDNHCQCCGMVFSCRGLLMNHLQRGSTLCLLNIVLTCDPLSPEEEEDQRTAAAVKRAEALLVGPNPNLAVMPAYRLTWVCKRVFDVTGTQVSPFDKRHPWYVGKGRINFGWKD